MAGPTSPLNIYLGIAPRSLEENAFRMLIRLSLHCVQGEEGSLLVYDHEKNNLVFAMTIGSEASEKALIGQRVPVGAGTTGRAAALRSVEFGTPTFHDLEFKARKEGDTGEPDFVVAAPMLLEEDLIGVITAVRFGENRSFAKKDGEILVEFARLAALIVEQNRRLKTYEDLQRTKSTVAPLTETEKLQLDVVRAAERLVGSRPESLKDIVDLLRSIERVVKR